MAIIGVGTDIVEIARIEALIFRYGDRLAKRVLSKVEWNFFYQLNEKQAIRFLAKRFAAKEAAAKAFGIGIRHGLSFNQFEVYNNHLGKPQLRFLDYALKISRRIKVSNIHISLADERHYACAIVIIEN